MSAESVGRGRLGDSGGGSSGSGSGSSRSRRETDELLATHTARRLVLVENTPTPFLNRKYAKTAAGAAASSTTANVASKQQQQQQQQQPTRCIPNTPAFGHRAPLSAVQSSGTNATPSTQTPVTLSKKLRKLYDVNALLSADDDLPGAPPLPPPQPQQQQQVSTTNANNSSNMSTNQKKKTNGKTNGKQSGEKVSSIFRPKLKTHSDADRSGNNGCELSFDSLKRRERRGQQLVVRRSEVFPSLVEKEHDSASPSPRLPTVHEQVAEAELPPPPAPAPKTTTPSRRISVTRRSTIDDISSLTQVTDRTLDDDKSTTSNHQHHTSLFSNDTTAAGCDRAASTDRHNYCLSDTQLDLILFGGGDDNIANIITDDESDDDDDDEPQRRSSTAPTHHHHVSSKQKQLQQQPVVKTPLKLKHRVINMSFMNLSAEQASASRQMLRKLEQMSAQDKSSRRVNVRGVRWKPNDNDSDVDEDDEEDTFSMRTTHVLADFDESFSPERLLTRHKCQLVLACLNGAVLVDREWLLQCVTARRWLDERTFTLDYYMDQEIDAYDPRDFDTRLLRLMRRLAAAADVNSKLFASHRNLLIVDVEADDESATAAELSMELRLERRPTREYVATLVQRCGGHLTSRVSHADMIVAVDESAAAAAAVEVASSGKRWQRRLLQLAKRVGKRRGDRGVPAVSSDWVLDSLLESSLRSVKKYQMATIYPKQTTFHQISAAL